jgi:hypothetical protein
MLTVIGAIASSGSGAPPPPTPTYTLTPEANTVDEGISLGFTVGGTNIVNGTYYWTISSDYAGESDFSTINGTVSVTGNSGTFSVTPTADVTTEGSETFNVTLRSGSITGTILATSTSVTITDTSLTPVAPFSLNFPAGNPYVLVANTQTDWNLGTVYTIEYWSKQTNASTWLDPDYPIRTVMAQGLGDGKIDMGYQNGHLMWNSSEPQTPEPAPAVWTHVAFVADGSGNITLYYNGVQQTTFNAGPPLVNGSLDLYIGRTPGYDGWSFYGKLAMIRVSSTAKYVANFNPIATYGVEADTRLMLGSDTPLVDTSASAHGITNSGAVISGDFPTTYTLTPEANSVNEGASLTFTVGGTKITNGNYYWTVTNSGDFGTTEGTFSITSNTGSFSVTPTADVTTEGSETFAVNLRSESTSGTILATSSSVTITDTSLAPVPPFSLQFVNSENDYLEVAQPSYTVLGSAPNHAWSGTISSGKIFKGSYPEPQVGWILIGQQEVMYGPYQVTIASVTDGGATWDLTWAPQVANNLYMDENYSLYDPALAVFNLGTTWTIEFWLKANASSDTAGGGIWGLLNQVGWSMTNAIVVALSDNKLVFLSVANNANDDVRYTEPTPGQWTHVAIANDAGTQKVFYNGVEQTRVSGNVGTASYTNGIAPLRIGRLGPANGGTLDGKMAMVRISNTAKYATAFTSTITYGVEADTELFLSSDTPLVDSMSLTVTNTGVTQSTDFPQNFIGHLNPYSGGNLGATYIPFGDPNITAFSYIPVGARITSNLSGFGIRQVTSAGAYYEGLQITYDHTGLPGGTVSTTSDTYNFYW